MKKPGKAKGYQHGGHVGAPGAPSASSHPWSAKMRPTGLNKGGKVKRPVKEKR
jgi:hypothetical protein